MKNYPQELKDRLTARLLAPHNESITALAGEIADPEGYPVWLAVVALGSGAVTVGRGAGNPD